ncbi:hypothetical protein [Candidatus Doolittlea endobia]|uniref:hypothetical protein n=1 Tax=Candidatus Doolittlea endobia TaxID=1778262 RepID=UPI001E2C4C6C|nr:hypothetical protein [Candidatus Doolittlea endobia]
MRHECSWFTRLAMLIALISKVSAMIEILIIIAVFLIISQSICLNICGRRNIINMIKSIGVTDKFILLVFTSKAAFLGWLAR